MKRFKFTQDRRTARSEISRENDTLGRAVFLDNQLNAGRAEHMPCVGPDRLHSGRDIE
jgi:hypothetical protein